MYTLHQFEISPFCDKVRRILHYKQLDYRTSEISVTAAVFGATRRLSPAGTLPVLQSDTDRLADSSAIAIYLENRHPDARPLVPADPHRRASVLLLEDWADEVLYFYEMYYRICDPAVWRQTAPLMLHADWPMLRPLWSAVVPGAVRKKLRQQGLSRRPRQDIGQSLSHLCADLSRMCAPGYLVGDSLTLADIAVWVQLHCIGQAADGQQQIARHRPLTDWMQRIERETAARPPA